MGVVLALLTGALSARGVRAEDCAGRHEFRPGIAHFDLLTSAGALAWSDPSRSGIPISPCAGLRCSAGDPSPPPPAAPVSTLRSERWGDLTVPPADSPLGASLLSFVEATAHPVHVGSALFRPPRNG